MYRSMLESLGLNGIRAIIGAVFFPVLSFYLSPEDLGRVGLFLSINAFLAPLIAGNLENLSWKKRFDEGDFETFKIVIIQITVALTVLFLGVTLIFSNFLRDMIGDSYLIQPLIALLDTWIIIKSVEFFSEHKHRQGNYLTISRQALNFILTILLLELVIADYQARIYGQLLAVLALGIYSIRSYLKNSAIKQIFSFKQGQYKSVITFMLLSYPGLIFHWIIFHSDKFFIEDIVGKEALGIYTMAYALGMAIYIADSAISQVWTSQYYKIAENNNLKKVYTGIGIQTVLITLIALVLIFVAPLIYKYAIDTGYEAGIQLVPIIVFSYVFFSISDKFKLFIMKSEKVIWITVNNGIAAFINIVLNIVLINKYGITGAAYSTLISYFVLMILNGVIGTRLIKIYHKDKGLQENPEVS